MGFSIKGAFKPAVIGAAIGGPAGAFFGSAIGGGALKQPGSFGGRPAYDEARLKAIQDRIAGLQGKLDASGTPKPLQAEAPPTNAALPEYAQIRAGIQNRISNQASASLGTAQNALARRFAAMGAGNSGAFIKQQQLALQNSDDQRNDALNENLGQVDFQEAQARRGMQEAATGRNFQRESFNADADFKDRVFKFDSSSKLGQLELAAVQAERDAQDSAFSKELDLYQLKHTGGLLGSGGVLGTGIF